MLQKFEIRDQIFISIPILYILILNDAYCLLSLRSKISSRINNSVASGLDEIHEKTSTHFRVPTTDRIHNFNYTLNLTCITQRIVFVTTRKPPGQAFQLEVGSRPPNSKRQSACTLTASSRFWRAQCDPSILQRFRAENSWTNFKNNQFSAQN